MTPIQARFDPITGLPIKTGPPPINTRTCLYHETRPMIVVEGKGETAAEKREDVARQIKLKQRDGYTLERPHGQHPHSFDEHRMEAQSRAADAGDPDAAEALAAKATIRADKEAPKQDDVATLMAQVADLTAKVAQMTEKTKKDPKKEPAI